MPTTTCAPHLAGRLIIRLLAALLVLTAAPMMVHAQEGSSPESGPLLRPSQGDDPYFTVELEPGESTALLVDVVNVNDEPLPVHTYAVNALTLVNGGFGVASADDAPSGPTQWLDYPSLDLTIDPGTAARLPVQVTVPDDAEPGEYLTAIAAEQSEPAEIEGAPSFHQQLRQAIAVFITIPGTLSAALEFADPSWNPGEGGTPGLVQFPVANSGNQYVAPGGRFTLSDGNGVVVSQQTVRFGAIYTGTSTRLEIAIDVPLSPGVYAIELDLSDARTGWSMPTDMTVMRVTVT